MDQTPRQLSAWELCEQLGQSLTADLQLEDPDTTATLIEPLESAMRDLPKCPDLPDTPAGQICGAVWAGLHAEDADVDLLLKYAGDPLPIVRFVALGALQATAEAPSPRWRQRGFAARARAALEELIQTEESPTVTFMLKALMQTTLKLVRPTKRPRAPIISNPYVAGMPIKEDKDFFGRQDILDKIQSKLGEAQGVKSLILFGARRSGKTSILLRIKDHRLGKSFVPVYIDMQSFAGVQPDIFLASLARATSNAISELVTDVQAPVLSRTDSAEFRISFQEFFKSVLGVVPGNVVIMIDEYEVLLEFIKNDPSLALQLQHLVESEPNLFFLFAGSRTIELVARQSSVPLLDAAGYLKITFLNREDTLALIKRPVQGILTYAPDVPERIVELTSGHPFYTQLICQSLFDAAISSDAVVTMEHLNQACEKFLVDPSPHLILTWNSLQHKEKVAASTLACLTEGRTLANPGQIIGRLKAEGYPSAPDTGEVREALKEMRDTGLVEEVTTEDSYRFTMELVRRWVVANRSVPALIDEQHKRLGERLPSLWRQMCAEIVDMLGAAASIFSGIALALLLGDFLPAAVSPLAVVFSCLILLMYFVLPMVAGRFTIGLRLLKLYPVSKLEMSRPSVPRSTLYGLMLLLRSTVICGAIWSLFLLLDERKVLSLQPEFFVVSTTLVIFIDNLMMRLTMMRQGLYEHLAGIILMYRS